MSWVGLCVRVLVYNCVCSYDIPPIQMWTTALWTWSAALHILTVCATALATTAVHVNLPGGRGRTAHAHCLRAIKVRERPVLTWRYIILCTCTFLPDNEVVHVVVSVDHAHFPGVVAMVTSLLSHTSDPQGVMVHVLVTGEGGDSLQQYLQCFDIPTREQVILILISAHLYPVHV